MANKDDYYALCAFVYRLRLHVVIVIGFILVVIYPVLTTDCASFTKQLLVTVFIASLLNYLIK